MEKDYPLGGVSLYLPDIQYVVGHNGDCIANTMFAAKFHLVSKSSGLYLGVSGEDSLVTQQRTCRNADSLLWQWQGSHLVSQEGRAMAVDKAREGKDGTMTINYNLAMIGAKLSAVSLAAKDTKQMWMMDEGVLKMVTKDFYVGIVSQEAGAEVELMKNSENPDDAVWLVINRGWLHFISYNFQCSFLR